jgi:hypothetical protein
MKIWLTIGVLAASTIAIKAAGPLARGQDSPPRRVANAIALVAPCLLSALVVYETVANGTNGFVLDSRAAGLLAAAVALFLKLPLIAVIAAAAATAAAVHALA